MIINRNLLFAPRNHSSILQRQLNRLGLFLLLSHHPAATTTTTTTSFYSSSSSLAFVTASSRSFSGATRSTARASGSSSNTGAARPLSSLFGGVFSRSSSNSSNSATSIMMSTTTSSTTSSSTTTTTTTTFSLEEAPADGSTHTTMLIGKRSVLQGLVEEKSNHALLRDVDSETALAVLDSIDGKSGAASTFAGKKQKLVLGVIPEKVSRNNHAWSVHSITDMVSSYIPAGGKTSRVVFCGDDDAMESVGSLTLCVAKAFSEYSEKTTSASRKKDEDKMKEEAAKKQRMIHINFCNEKGKPLVVDADTAKAALAAAQGVQLAARLVDMPPELLTTDAYAAECQALAKQLGDCVTYTEIKGEELNRRGYGGIYGVGKAATCPPRLVIMEYTPPNYADDGTSKKTAVALVGKSIVYDTGGLSLKPKVGMCGMKADMGGSAGVLGGFVSAVKSGSYPHKLYLLLCMAENAIGPTAVRNDDILHMLSGKTVEINNADAEGRLVLGDGVAHATRYIPNLNLVVDMATLTGAQMVATGQKHASILTNQQELETKAVAAGLRSGDLCHPIVYAPELLMKEFDSKVADMKNSVKDRSNAQASCAGHFIESHLDEDYEGGWLHVDMAGPASSGERGTGYGVGLVLSLLGVKGF